MQQPQNPSQGGYSRSDQSGPASAFPINLQNPYNQPQQAFYSSTQYNSNYQPLSEDFERNSLLNQADAALSIDRQLSSGCWVFYKWILYYMLFLSCCCGFMRICLISFASHFSLFSLLMFIQFLMQMAFPVITIDVLKHKNLDKARQAFKLAIAGLVFITFNSWAQGLQVQATPIEEQDEIPIHSFFVLAIFFIPQHLLMIVIPAWRLKLHVERRDAILKQNSDLYNL